ncbi:MAG TPA: hypothetical protein VNF73_17750 [Candidatus Saccharimonadales bacterium]|nr:hypothetical protein [Candidatus Saccharimonadales bacterium]
MDDRSLIAPVLGHGIARLVAGVVCDQLDVDVVGRKPAAVRPAP